MENELIQNARARSSVFHQEHSFDFNPHRGNNAHPHQRSNSFVHDTCNVYVLCSGGAAVLIDFGSGDVLDQLAAIGVDRVTDVLMAHHYPDQGLGLARAAHGGIRI
jgi:glyoxylase-like metal-dependent hydrolase (beta-lactamase superfamily II)